MCHYFIKLFEICHLALFTTPTMYFVIFKQTLERIVVKMSDIDDDSEIYFSVKVSIN